MRYLIVLSILLESFAFARSANDPLLPLMLYNGSWHVTRTGAASPETLVNQCARAGNFLTCGQTVNGGAGTLLVFIPRADKPGQYYTQNVRSDGSASSRGNLEISGNIWTFTNRWNDGHSTTFYKTVNTFKGRNQIHFEQFESSDEKEWKLTGGGDDTRVASGR